MVADARPAFCFEHALRAVDDHGRRAPAGARPVCGVHHRLGACEGSVEALARGEVDSPVLHARYMVPGRMAREHSYLVPARGELLHHVPAHRARTARDRHHHLPHHRPPRWFLADRTGHGPRV
jgi:hypothetical protein